LPAGRFPPEMFPVPPRRPRPNSKIIYLALLALTIVLMWGTDEESRNHMVKGPSVPGRLQRLRSALIVSTGVAPILGSGIGGLYPCHFLASRLLIRSSKPPAFRTSSSNDITFRVPPRAPSRPSILARSRCTLAMSRCAEEN
jgi:hypothetical protein